MRQIWESPCLVAFDVESADMLDKLGTPAYKVASFDQVPPVASCSERKTDHHQYWGFDPR